MSNREYWQKRALKREEEAYKKADEIVRLAKNHYEQAVKELEEKIAVFYARYSKEQGLDPAEAARVLNSAEAKEWKKTLGEYMEEISSLPEGRLKKRLKAELDARAYRSRIDRLSALKAQIDMEIDRLFYAMENSLTESLGAEYEGEYYHKIFDIQKRAGNMFDFARLNVNMVEKVITYPWSGADYSSRIWRNKNTLLFHLQEILTQSVIQGKGVVPAAKALAEKMDSSYKAAENLIRTEMSRIHSEADAAAYEAAGIEEYEFMATNEVRTCEVCGRLDGKIFKVSERQIGVNCNPIHPRCRCTTVEHDPEEEQDWIKSGIPMPKRTTYEEWYKKQVAEHGEGYVEIKRKKEYNNHRDFEEYKGYANILGKNTKITFEKFQDIKYSGRSEYEQFKAYAKGVQIGEITPLADFSLYKQVSEDIDKKLIGITTSNGIVIKGKSKHFIARVIGSVEQRRNGVTIEQVIETLTNPEKVDKAEDRENGRSQKFFSNDTAVSVDPDTGILIQTNPKNRKRRTK